MDRMLRENGECFLAGVSHILFSFLFPLCIFYIVIYKLLQIFSLLGELTDIGRKVWGWFLFSFLCDPNEIHSRHTTTVQH